MRTLSTGRFGKDRYMSFITHVMSEDAMMDILVVKDRY